MNKTTLLCGVVLFVGCARPSDDSARSIHGQASFAGIARADLPQLDRHEFNRLAALENVNLYWKHPEMKPASFVLLGAADGASPYVIDGELTAAFDRLYARLVNRRRIEAVTAADVLAAARKYLVNPVIVVTTPTPPGEEPAETPEEEMPE